MGSWDLNDICGSDLSCKSNLAKHKETKKCQRFLRCGRGLRFGEGLIRKGEESRCGHNFGDGIYMDEGATQQANKKLQELQFLRCSVSQVWISDWLDGCEQFITRRRFWNQRSTKIWCSLHRYIQQKMSHSPLSRKKMAMTFIKQSWSVSRYWVSLCRFTATTKERWTARSCKPFLRRKVKRT